MTPMPWMTRPCAPSPIVSPSSISEGIEPTCADCESKSGEMPGGFPGSHASRHVECTSESIWRQCSRHSRLMAELGRGSAPSEEMVKSEYHLSFPVLIALCRPCVQSSCMASTSEASGDTSRSFCMTLKKGRGQTRCAPTSSASNAFIFLAMRTTGTRSLSSTESLVCPLCPFSSPRSTLTSTLQCPCRQNSAQWSAIAQKTISDASSTSVIIEVESSDGISNLTSLSSSSCS